MDKTALPFGNRGRRIPREGARLRRAHGISVTSETCAPAPRRAKDAITRDVLVRGIDAWLTQCHARKMSAATLYSRKFVTDKLLWFMEQNALDICDRDALGKFLAYAGSAPKDGLNRWGGTTKQPASQREAKPETVATYHRMLRTLFRWLATEEYLAESPMEKIKPPIVRADQIMPLSQDQVKSLLNAAKDSEYPMRNKAICLLLLDTGMRASELCTLRLCDVDKDGCKVVVQGKGNKRRVLYYGSAVARALGGYLRIDVRQPMDPLFYSERGNAAGSGLTRSGLTQLIERLGKKADISSIRCSPHTLRHTWALTFLRGGGSIFALKELLGHTSLTISNRYVHLAGADLEAQSRLASPMDNMVNPKR